MERSMIRLALAMVAFSLPTEAWALDYYMTGGGVRLGTSFLPAKYPINFSPKISKYDIDGDKETDLDEQGVAINSSLERVGFDGTVGGEGYYYLHKNGRIGGIAGAGFGKRFVDVNFLAIYDYVVPAGGSMDLAFGGGAGFGSQLYRGAEDPESLRINYYPIRAKASAMLRDNSRAYQATLFGQYNIAASHNWVALDGQRYDVGTGVYLQMGIEFAVMFGDFTPPRPKKKKKPTKKK
jgi:hypothetical protein